MRQRWDGVYRGLRDRLLRVGTLIPAAVDVAADTMEHQLAIEVVVEQQRLDFLALVSSDSQASYEFSSNITSTRSCMCAICSAAGSDDGAGGDATPLCALGWK